MSNEQDRIKTIQIKIEAEATPTFCLAKWQHVTMYLQTGETHSCYHPQPHKIPLDELAVNPSALHNTMHKKLERKEMLEGKAPVGCQYCWNIEKMGPDYISDRHIRNASIFTEERYEQALNGAWDQNINPEYLEINFGNECNFKCGYCHPKYSSRYHDEVKKYGPVRIVKNHALYLNEIDLPKREEDNPYVDAFWKWWPELRLTLNIMRVTGGEPTMHKSTWQLLNELSDNPLPKLELNINSNLGTKTALIEKLSTTVRKLREDNKIRAFKLFTSVDTWGPRAEYIRTGLDLKLWETNLHTYLTLTQSPIVFMITFNILSVTTFKSLLEKILEYRTQYPWYTHIDPPQHRIRFDTPYLRDPLQYSMTLLPKEEFMPYMYESLQFMKDNLDDNASDKFTTVEYEKFKRVVDLMAATDMDEDDLIDGRTDFYNWFNELDKRRDTNLLEVFPEMTDFYNLCKLTDETQ